MSGLADSAGRAGTSLDRLPPLMRSRLWVVFFRPCFPQVIQPEQMILVSLSYFSIILLNLLLCRLSPCTFTFPINLGAGGQY